MIVPPKLGHFTQASKDRFVRLCYVVAMRGRDSRLHVGPRITGAQLPEMGAGRSRLDYPEGTARPTKRRKLLSYIVGTAGCVAQHSGHAAGARSSTRDLGAQRRLAATITRETTKAGHEGRLPLVGTAGFEPATP